MTWQPDYRRAYGWLAVMFLGAGLCILGWVLSGVGAVALIVLGFCLVFAGAQAAFLFGVKPHPWNSRSRNP